MNNLTQIGKLELRHDPSTFGEISESLHLGDNLPDQALPHLGYLLVGTPGDDVRQIGDRRLGKFNA